MFKSKHKEVNSFYNLSNTNFFDKIIKEIYDFKKWVFLTADNSCSILILAIVSGILVGIIFLSLVIKYVFYCCIDFSIIRAAITLCLILTILYSSFKISQRYDSIGE